MSRAVFALCKIQKNPEHHLLACGASSCCDEIVGVAVTNPFQHCWLSKAMMCSLRRRLQRRPSAVSFVRVGFIAASLAVMSFQAMTSVQVADLTRSFSLFDATHHESHTIAYSHSEKNATSPLSLPKIPARHDDDQQEEQSRVNTSRLPDATAFGACLMVKDDNDLLYEWLAYHYTMLPLGYVVIGSDLGSSQDPAVVLDRWKGLNLTWWLLRPEEYINRHGNYSEAFGDVYNDNRTHRSEEEETAHHHHALIHRQKGFLTTCMELLKAHGVGWTLLIDSDEFLVLNPLTPEEEAAAAAEPNPAPDESDKNDGQESTGSVSTRSRRMLASAMAQNMSFRDVLESIAHLDSKRIGECYTMPRLLVGALENETCPGVDTTRAFAKSIVNGRFSQLSTLRYFQHARKGDFARSKFGKVLLDLSAIDDETVRHQVPANIHRPFRQYCSSAGGNNFANEYFFLLHYIGSWERYAARSDHRRSRIEWEKRSTVNDDTSACAADITRWWFLFTRLVGHETAKNLLGVDSEYGTLSPL